MSWIQTSLSLAQATTLTGRLPWSGVTSSCTSALNPKHANVRRCRHQSWQTSTYTSRLKYLGCYTINTSIHKSPWTLPNPGSQDLSAMVVLGPACLDLFQLPVDNLRAGFERMGRKINLSYPNNDSPDECLFSDLNCSTQWITNLQERQRQPLQPDIFNRMVSPELQSRGSPDRHTDMPVSASPSGCTHLVNTVQASGAATTALSCGHHTISMQCERVQTKHLAKTDFSCRLAPFR